MSARVVGWVPGSGRVDQSVAAVTRLGATGANEIAVPVDGVSRQHARITEEADGYWIEDARSKNGTWVNGQRVTRAKLRHLDVITLGRFAELVFLARAPEAAPPTALRLHIEWLNGPEAGRSVEIAQGETVIGRADSCGLVVVSGSISRAHARLLHNGDAVLLEDLGSVNGTMVNGRPVTAPMPLESGAEVELGGDRRFRVAIDGQRTTAAGGQASPAAAQDMEWMTKLVWSESDLEAVRAGLVQAKVGASSRKPPAISSPSPASGGPPQRAVPSPPAGAAPEAMTELGTPAFGEGPPAKTELATRGVSDLPSEIGRAAGTIIEGPAPAPPPFGELPGATGPVVEHTQVGGPAPALPANWQRPRGQAAPTSLVGRPELPSSAVLGYRDVAPGTPKPSSNAPPPAPLGPSAPGEGTSIVGVRLSGNIGTFDLPLGIATIGRSDQATVRIDSRDVSRVHAILTVGEQSVTLEDRGSVNGTILNGTPMLGTHPLSDGDRVAIADFEFLVEFQRTETKP